MRYLTVFIRLIIFICVLVLSFTLYSSIINGDRRDPSVPSQNTAKADYTSRDVTYHVSTKQVNKDSRKLLQEKAKQKRADKIIKARDKLIREKGYKIYKYGDKQIIRAKGVVRPDLEKHPSQSESTKKKEDVSKNPDEKIQNREKEQSNDYSKKESECDKHEFKRETDISNHFITLNNNLQYDLIREVYIFWVTPAPQEHN